jgi:hypothetical protein
LNRLTRQSLFLFLALGTFPQAHASNPVEPSAADIATAREMFREGARLAAEEKWAEALDAYQRSMALRPSNLTRYSIAVVQERMGKLIEAMENLREFISSDHDTTTRRYVPAAEETLQNLEGRIGRVKVVIPGNPRGAQVKIDDDVLPQAAIGIFRPTDPGHRRVEARVPGYARFVKEVNVQEGASIEVVVRLAPPGAEEGDEDVPPSSAAESQGGSQKTTGMILTIGGAGVFVAGLGVGIYGYSKAKSAETSDSPEADTARTTALIGDIGMGVGLVAAGVGTYLLLSGGESTQSTARQVFINPWAVPGGAGFGASGRF